jgi:aconitate hydratase
MSSDLRETSMDKLVALNTEYGYYSLPLAAKQLGNIDRLPKSMKVLLENLLRHVDGDTVQVDDLKAIVGWLQTGHADREIAYRPARVLMQGFYRCASGRGFGCDA